MPTDSHRLYTSLAAVMAFNLTHVFRLVSGSRYCRDTMECFLLPGHICQDNRCICDPGRDTGLFACVPARVYGEQCRTNEDCRTDGDSNLICVGIESRTCRCHRRFVWDVSTKRCYSRIDDETYTTNKFDPVRDLIIPGIIVMTIGAMMYLGIKLFCNCGKLWRRGPRGIDSPREMEECPTQPPGTWVASYRVFSSLERSPSSQFPHHALHHAPPASTCLLLPANAAPPPYEEALKHKVILSSYHSPCLPPPPQDPPPSSSTHES